MNVFWIAQNALKLDLHVYNLVLHVVELFLTMGLLLRSCSFMISHQELFPLSLLIGCFAYFTNHFLSTCGAWLEVVFLFE